MSAQNSPTAVGAVLAACACAIAIACAPLLRAPWSAGDLARLQPASARERVLETPESPPPGPIERVWLRATRASGERLARWTARAESALAQDAESLGGRAARAPAWLGRAENAVLLLACACFVGALGRRLLLPWTGREHARAAGFAAAVFAALHPLQAAQLARLDARGELLALALGLASAAAYLRGRQERSPRWIACAVVLAAALQLGVGPCLWHPPLVAAIELASAGRWRAFGERVQRAASCAAAASALLLLAWFARAHWFGLPAFSLESELALVRGGSTELANLGARTALLALPVNGASAGAPAWIAAGVLLLVCLQPLFTAARNAPRLWGGLFVCGVGAALASLLLGGGARMPRESFVGGSGLALAAMAAALALAAAATALSGWRRVALPACVGLGFAGLFASNAQAYARAAESSAELERFLAATHTLHGADALYLVLDPPREVAGVRCVGSHEVAALLPSAPAAAGGAEPEGRGAAALEQRALLALLRQAEQRERLRDRRIVLVCAARELEPGARGYAAAFLRVPAAGPALAAPPAPWRGDGRSPDLSVDPLEWDALELELPGERANEGAPLLRWRAANALVGSGACAGRAESAARWSFDLSQSLAWRLSEEVRRVWFEGVGARVEKAELRARLSVADVPEWSRREGDDWIFGRAAGAAASAPTASLIASATGSALELQLLELRSLRGARLALEPDGPGTWRARGVERLARELARSADARPPAEVWTAPLARDPSSASDSLREEPGSAQAAPPALLVWELERVSAGVALARRTGVVGD